LRIALAGLGSAATRAHLPALERLNREFPLTLVAAADPSAERRRLVDSFLRDTPVFEEAHDMLATVQCDTLVIATPPACHGELILLGARYGVHVVCEKPLVLDRHQQAQVAELYRSRPELALIAVHQYRHSPLWALASSWLRHVDRSGMPIILDVEVQRSVADPYATSDWRTQLAASGGALADHGVHFLALAHTISNDIDVRWARRELDGGGGEHSRARVSFGSGVLNLATFTGAPQRSTALHARVTGAVLRWRDYEAEIILLGRTVRRWPVESLSDREHIDELYVPFYRDTLANLTDPDWRRARTDEALRIGGAVVAMLKDADAPVAGADCSHRR
jgi:predicted dehydrogenase